MSVLGNNKVAEKAFFFSLSERPAAVLAARTAAPRVAHDRNATGIQDPREVESVRILLIAGCLVVVFVVVVGLKVSSERATQVG
jgi:hypothetical protein